jgi:hypothetical protein
VIRNSDEVTPSADEVICNSGQLIQSANEVICNSGRVTCPADEIISNLDEVIAFRMRKPGGPGMCFPGGGIVTSKESRPLFRMASKLLPADVGDLVGEESRRHQG